MQVLFTALMVYYVCDLMTLTDLVILRLIMGRSRRVNRRCGRIAGNNWRISGRSGTVGGRGGSVRGTGGRVLGTCR